MSHERTTPNLLEFIIIIKEPILGFISFVSTVNGFWQSLKSDSGLLIIVLAGLILLLEVVCLYYFFLWKPKPPGTNSSIIFQSESNAIIKSQRKVKKQKKIVRLLSAVGLFLFPIIIWGGLAIRRKPSSQKYYYLSSRL
jgi:hypothetical protein